MDIDIQKDGMNMDMIPSSQQCLSFNQISDVFSRGHDPITHAHSARCPALVRPMFNECCYCHYHCHGQRHRQSERGWWQEPFKSYAIFYVYTCRVTEQRLACSNSAAPHPRMWAVDAKRALMLLRFSGLCVSLSLLLVPKAGNTGNERTRERQSSDTEETKEREARFDTRHAHRKDITDFGAPFEWR